MRIVFMGTPDFAVPSLKGLLENGYTVVEVVTQPDRPKGRKKEMTPSPVKVAALSHGLSVFQPEKLRDDAAVAHILSLQPDLIVTAAYGQILPKAIIDAPRYGCINVHASLLPKYRGGAPIHQAIIDGQKVTGVTIMYMVEKLDAGDILTQVTVPIEQSDHVGTMFDKLATAGGKLLLETLPRLMTGELMPIPQSEADVTYARNIRREDELIQWQRTAEQIYNQIRGLHPWPVAYTMINEEVMKVWWGEIGKQAGQVAEPGTIVAVTPTYIEVACGQGTIYVTDIQPAGKKRMPVTDYVRGSGANVLLGKQFASY